MPVEFNEPEFGTTNRAPQRREKGIVGLIMKMGLAKNASQANIIMIGLIVVLALVSWFAISSTSAPDAAPAEELPDPQTY